MSGRGTIDPGAGTDAEALPSIPPDSVDRIASFLFVAGAILLLLSAFLLTVRGFEEFLQIHFQEVVDRSIQVAVSPRSPAESIRINLGRNVENSDWVRIWGVKVSVVEIKEVELPPTMIRAIGAQAEAERERRAKIVHAEGEMQAAEKLAEAARIIGMHPSAMQLRYLQTLTTIATEHSSTVIFPLPMDLVTPLLKAAEGAVKKR